MVEKKGENDEEKELTGGKEEGEVEVEEKVEGDDEDDDDEVHETPVNSLTLKQSSTLPAGGGRLLLFQRYAPALMRELELEYKMYMAEVVQLTANTQRSIDVNLEVSACYKCDPRLKPMLNVPVQANLQLKQHIKFVPPNPFHQGYFVYSRLWNGKHRYLPSGEREAKLRTEKLLNKLNKRGDAVPREATYRLQTLYAEKGITFATNFDLAQENTYLSLLGVLKHGSSTSVRFCVSPNYKFQTKIGPLSYNNCIKVLSTSQPKMYRFQIEKMFSSLTTLSDISQQFPSIHLDYPTSLHCMYFCYKDTSGWPTFVQTQSCDGLLYAVKNARLIFGHQDSPAVSQFTMLEASEVYRQYNRSMSAIEQCLVSMIKAILTFSRFADDIQTSCTQKRVEEYCKITGTSSPKAPPISETCIEQGTCTGKHEIFTLAMFESFKREFLELSRQLMIKLCETLVKILNFAGFSLKYLHGEENLQNQLNDMIANQTCNQQKPDVRVIRPTTQEVSEHISKLGKFEHHDEFQRPDLTLDKKFEIEHLGYLYSKEQIELKIKSMALIYFDGKQNRRTPEFFSYEQFQRFDEEYRPIFTRRSLFSAVARGGDSQGKILCLYRSQLKIAIRLFLKREPNAKWEAPLDTDSLMRLKAALKSYFFLVQQKLPQTDVFRYSGHQLFLVGTCDGAEHLFTLSVTLIARSCLAGVVSSTAEHVALHPYSVNVHIVSMVEVELLGMLRLCAEMGIVVDELQRLGLDLPGKQRYIYTDSKILLTLLRQKIQYMKKKYAHGISKIQLKLHDLKMDPYSSVAYVCQRQGTLFSDYFSKITSFTIENTENKFRKIHDMTWIESAHPRRLTGVTFETALPSGAELRYLEDNAILETEMESFQLDVKNTTCPDIDQILSAASKCKVNQSSGGGGCSDCEWEKNDVENEYKNLCLGETSSDSEYENLCKSENDQKDKDTHRDKIDKQTNKETDKDKLMSPKEAISVSDVWRKEMDLLLERKRSFGLGARSILAILKICVTFIRKCKAGSKQGPQNRKHRQAERQRDKMQKSEEVKHLRKVDNFRDLHDRPVRALDLINSNLGYFDDLLQLPANPANALDQTSEREVELVQKKEVELVREREVDDQDCRKAFHHLTSLYQSNLTMRGFEKRIYKNIGGGETVVWEGRRHRNYDEQKLRRSRLRSIKGGSQLESTLLKAAHDATRGQNLPKAELSVYNLQVHIVDLKKKLQKLQHSCCSCRRRRALSSKETDKVKKRELGPSDYMNRAIRWLEGKQTAVIDCVGPLQCWGTFEGSHLTKLFAVVIIELPLKTCHIVPLRSYSSEHFLLAMRTFVARRLAPMDIWIGDAGSNFKRLQNSSAGFLLEDEELHQDEKLNLYKELETGDKVERLREAGLFIRASSGDHSVVGVCEKAVATVKQCIRSFGLTTQSPLTYFEWDYLWAQVSHCIASRPVHSSKDGRLYTAMGLLNLMGRTGWHIGEDQLDVKINSKDEVSARLEKMEEHMASVKRQVAEILLQVMIQPSFINQQTRKECIKVRDEAEDAQTNSVYFCPRLFTRCCNFTGSLLRLCRLGLSKQTGLFQRSGKLKAGSYVTRNLGDLYLIAEANRDQTLGQEVWLPTWNLGKALEKGSMQRGYLVWEENEEQKDLSCNEFEETEKKGDQESEDEEEEAGKERDKKKKEKRAERVRERKKEEEKTEGEDEKEEEKTTRRTRIGRTIKTPKRYQAEW